MKMCKNARICLAASLCFSSVPYNMSRTTKQIFTESDSGEVY